ncbi:MAG: Na+/H+ antiporter subunit E [Trueperaceae bacterium]
MNLFLLNILLALLWAVLTGTMTPTNLVIGFIVGLVALAMVGRALGRPLYVIGLWRGVVLLFVFLWELIVSSLRVTYDVLSPGHNYKPAILAVPIDLDKDFQITLLANLVSLTPGTLSLDVSKDKKTLFIHSMNAPDPEALKQSIKNSFERRIKELSL